MADATRGQRIARPSNWARACTGLTGVGCWSKANSGAIFNQISSVSKRSVAIAASGTFEDFRFAVSEPQPTRVREKARAKRSVFSGTKTLRPVKFKLDL